MVCHREQLCLLLSAFRDKKAKKKCCCCHNRWGREYEADSEEKRNNSQLSRVDEYNQHMNGCDRTDQQIQFYGLQKRKSNKWWKKIVHFFIEIAVVNASIIYNKTQPLVDGVRRKVPLAAFKNNLI